MDRDRAQSFLHHVGYDLGRAFRHVSDGADTLTGALEKGGAMLRTLEQRWSRRSRPSTPEPRVEVVVDPRARARGRYVPATIAVAIDREQRIEWRSTIDGLEDLSRGALGVVQSLQVGNAHPLLALAGDQGMTWEHVQELAEVSGLAGALREVRRAALRHDRDAVLAKLADRLEALAPEQRRALGSRFLERLAPHPVVQEVLLTTGFQPVELRPGDLDQLAQEVASSARDTLSELGLSPAEVTHLAEVAQDVAAPLVQLTEFYLNPTTRIAKVKRYFRLQRVGFTVLKIASRPSFGAARLVGAPGQYESGEFRPVHLRNLVRSNSNK